MYVVLCYSLPVFEKSDSLSYRNYILNHRQSAVNEAHLANFHQLLLGISVQNREVLLWVTNCHVQQCPCMGQDSGPTPNALSLCQDDINLIVTCLMLSLTLF